MDDKERKELMDKVSETMILEKLISDIKTQEARFLLLDLDNLKDEDKELIKAYRKNLRTLYTRYSKSERISAGDIESDFFKPSPTNEMEDKIQRDKQSTFDQLMHLKEVFYKKLIFQFKGSNIELLKNLQKSLEKMLNHKFSNKNSISNVVIPEDKLDKVLKENGVEMNSFEQNDIMKEIVNDIKKGKNEFDEDKTINEENDKEDLYKKSKTGSMDISGVEDNGPTQVILNQNSYDKVVDTIDLEDYSDENYDTKSLDENVNEVENNNSDFDNDDKKIEIDLNALDNKFLSDNEIIGNIELPKIEPVKGDIREKQIDEIFDTLNKDKKEETSDFKISDGSIDYDTKNILNETINKIVSFEQAFKELNLNNVTLLTLAFIKEYQAVLKRFKTEFTDVQREEAGAKSRSIVFGDTPLYFKLGNQSESDKKLEENYNIVINELKKDVEKFIHIDVNQYDEIDFEWLKRFQARLNLADTFFEEKEMEKHI